MTRRAQRLGKGLAELRQAELPPNLGAHVSVKASFCARTLPQNPKTMAALEQAAAQVALNEKKGRSVKKHGKPEHAIQAAFVTRVRGLVRLIPELELCHAPKNDFKRTGNQKRDFATWNYLHQEGAEAGIPDWHCPIPVGEYAGFWVEFKAPGEKPTDKQLRKMELLNSNGSMAIWTDSADEAWAAFVNYMRPHFSKKGVEVR